ncbi:MAG: hypothetical protein PHQ96_02900 [Candidatus Omnitrophica bacterium]|nr:hypothetical protein [Candidatus Omnitrophota bacterium]
MCYVAPLSGAIVTTFIWNKRKSVESFWLGLLFYGGVFFGIIDHLWNGELFLISKNLSADLLLGVAITCAILLFWGLLLILAKINPTISAYVNIKNSR